MKSHEAPKENERHHIDIVRDINNKQETQDVYKNFKELCDRTLQLKYLENLLYLGLSILLFKVYIESISCAKI